jgi:hypothetical protein
MPTAITLAIALFTSKTFLSRHLFHEDGKGHVEFLKGEKLNKMFLMFSPLCSIGICNFIVSLKQHPDNSGSINYILKLKALSSYDYIYDNCFLGQQVGQKVYLFKTSINGTMFGFDLVWRMQPGDDLQNACVTMPLLEKCEDETHIPEMGSWESTGTLKTLQFDCRGQNTLPWGVHYIIEKLSKHRCRKWACMSHSKIYITSYGKKKGKELNW